MKPIVAKIQEPKNQLVITLVTLTILLLVWGPVRPTDALDRITSSSGTWTPACDAGGLACMPLEGCAACVGREGFATTVINNQIIVTHGSAGSGGGGAADTPSTRIYDIQGVHKDTWSSGTAANVTRAEVAGATDGHLHYVVGGRGRGSDGNCAASGSFGVCRNLEAYDPVKNKWATLEPMKTARAGLAAVVVGHNLYAIGGRTAGTKIVRGVPVPDIEPDTGTALGCLEAYDIDTGHWGPACTASDALAQPMAVMDVAAIAVGGKIYVIGASTDLTSPSVQIYDVATNAPWIVSNAAGMAPRANLALAACGNVILALGGRTSGGGDTSKTVQASEVTMGITGIWVPLNDMRTAKSEHGAVSQGDVVHVLGSGIRGASHDYHEALTCSSLFSNKK